MYKALSGFALAIGLAAGCSASSGGDSGNGGGGVGQGGGGAGNGGLTGVGSGGTGGSIQIGGGPGNGGGGTDPDGGCNTFTQEAKQTFQPADIVWAVDTSCSMIEEAQAVQTNINAFSQQIVASGIDAHVVMLAAYPFLIIPGICVPAPLGTGQCPGDTNLPGFFHHPTGIIESVDAALKLVQLFPDYKFMFRPGALKYIVVVTDDDSRNNPDSSGNAGKYDNNPDGFINDYTALDPMLIDGAGNKLWKLSAIYSFTQCANAAQVGQVWKQIVDKTGGVHGDICNCPPGNPAACAQTFQQVFDQLATKIIQGSQPLECDWNIPPPPAGEKLDPQKVNVELEDKATGAKSTIYHVNDAASCDPTLGGWYYDDNANPTRVIACPASCDQIKATTEGKINVVFGCATQNIPA